jgi:hypothetical protein
MTDWGVKSETQQRLLWTALTGGHLTKRSDTPRLINGIERRFFEGTDFYGSMPIKGQDYAIHVECEVKSYRDQFPLSRLSAEQRKFLADSYAARELALVVLMEHDDEVYRSVYWIPWPNFLGIETELLKRVSGNYQGKTLRMLDVDLTAPYRLDMKARSWVLPTTHPLYAIRMGR